MFAFVSFSTLSRQAVDIPKDKIVAELFATTKVRTFKLLISRRAEANHECKVKMEQKQIPPQQNVGFQNVPPGAAPPAYDQHQQFSQQYVGQPGVYQGLPQQGAYPGAPQQGVYPGGPQVVTGNFINISSSTNRYQNDFIILVITGSPFGPDPAVLSCPSCRQQIVTRIDYESTTKTHLMAGLICLLFWPCFCLPYMVDSCKSANHYCK